MVSSCFPRRTSWAWRSFHVNSIKVPLPLGSPPAALTGQRTEFKRGFSPTCLGHSLTSLNIIPVRAVSWTWAAWIQIQLLNPINHVPVDDKPLKLCVSMSQCKMEVDYNDSASLILQQQ